jgi:hypothetical protein
MQATIAATSRRCPRLNSEAVVYLGKINMALCSAVDVRFGSKADICAAIRHVRFTPDNDRESGFRTRSCLLAGPSLIKLNIDTGRPASFSQFISEGSHTRLHFSVCRQERHHNADPTHALALCVRNQWP